MKQDINEIKAVKAVEVESVLVELADLQLVLIGGGTGEVVIA